MLWFAVLQGSRKKLSAIIASINIVFSKPQTYLQTTLFTIIIHNTNYNYSKHFRLHSIIFYVAIIMIFLSLTLALSFSQVTVKER